MGTFACYAGRIYISKEKWNCFGQQMMKILNYGGMMQLDQVSLFDRKLLLLNPVELS